MSAIIYTAKIEALSKIYTFTDVCSSTQNIENKHQAKLIWLSFRTVLKIFQSFEILFLKGELNGPFMNLALTYFSFYRLTREPAFSSQK